MQLIDLKYLVRVIPKLLPSLFSITLKCVIVTIIAGSVFGVLLVLCKLGRRKWLRKAAYTITDIIRGTPFLVMLFLLYYALPKFIPALNSIDKMVFLILTMTIFAASRLSEIMRSAYEAIDKFQMEAALSVGLSVPQALIHVVVPQAFYIALPNLGNFLVGIILENALGFTIGIYDVMGTAKLINAKEYGAHNMEVYLAAALIFWILSLIIAWVTGRMELFLKKDHNIKQPKKLQTKADF